MCECKINATNLESWKSTEKCWFEGKLILSAKNSAEILLFSSVVVDCIWIELGEEGEEVELNCEEGEAEEVGGLCEEILVGEAIEGGASGGMRTVEKQTYL